MHLPLFVTRALGSLKLGAVEHAPELLTVGGTVGMIATVVTACKATLEFQEVLKVHNERMAKLDAIEIDRTAAGHVVNEADAIDIPETRMGIWVETAKSAVKIYYKPAILGLLSVSAFMGATGIFKKRYLSMAGAFIQLFDENKALKSELERARTGKEEIDAHVDTETGEVIEDGTSTVSPEERECMFSRFFDESNPNWEKSSEANRIFLQNTERFANNRLHMNGHLFFNELLDMLGYEKTQTGQMFGWIDDGSEWQIDFGIFNANSKAKRRFVNGIERSILLTFNVDPKPIIGRTGLPVS